MFVNNKQRAQQLENVKKDLDRDKTQDDIIRIDIKKLQATLKKKNKLESSKLRWSSKLRDKEAYRSL